MMSDFGLPVMAVMIGLILNVPMSKTKNMFLIPTTVYKLSRVDFVDFMSFLLLSNACNCVHVVKELKLTCMNVSGPILLIP